MEPKVFSIDVGGRTLSAEFNTLAERAHGACLLRYGNSAVLATVVMAREERAGINFIPLTVDYEEKFYAAGAILGSRYLRREGRPSEQAILSGRVVDRSIRPLFPKSLRKEVQVIITVLAIDEDDPDTLAVIAASLALGVSHIPWNGPVSALRLGKQTKENDFSINPRYLERNASSYYDLLVCGQSDLVTMIEAEGKEVPEALVSASLERSLPELARLQKFQKEIIKEMGKEKEVSEEKEPSSEIVALFNAETKEALEKELPKKPETLNELEEKWLTLVKEKLPDIRAGEARQFFERSASSLLHKAAISGRRLDGRALDEIRPLYTSVGSISPVLHGTGVFYRGGTHVLSVLTLGGPEDSLFIDSLEARKVSKRFMHHYNFPPFSAGETGRVGAPNRRMVGHGALAEKALEPVIPSPEQFPYTIRLVSECLASNGSTSMASICASSLALMDGGVPISRPVAGIAIGLLTGEGGEQILLTDIQGAEDHLGDMDFKVAGTSEGVTALQLDVKVSGVSVSLLGEALARAKGAREIILATISQTLPTPRKEVSPRAPHILTLTIHKDQIGSVIGPQGKTVREIQEKTGASISVEDDGRVFVTGRNGAAEKARTILEEMTREYKRGESFEGVVIKVTDFGAFVRIGYHTEGLLHISEMHEEKLAEGQNVRVKIKETDERGRISLSL